MRPCGSGSHPGAGREVLYGADDVHAFANDCMHWAFVLEEDADGSLGRCDCGDFGAGGELGEPVGAVS